MSQTKIRAALEVALGAMTPSLVPVWENVAYKPVVGVPYQKVTTVFAQPGNTEFGPLHEERGYLQTQLAFPAGVGSGDAAARADLILSTFPRGRTLASGGQTVVIDRTPQVLPGFNDDDRYFLTVRIPFFAQVLG